MPFISISSQAGPANISYTISTPTCTSAEKIDPDIPTVIFLHPVYATKMIFEPQFVDPKLRRLNLVILEMRLHGSTEGDVPEGWGCQDAAHDLVAFMNALQLPPCHIMGLSMGARTAMQMSISYPERVLSLFLVSPIPIQEPKEVTQGRQEIYEVWTQAWTDPVNPDRETLTHAITGALQLAVNSASTPFIKAIVKTTMPYSLKQFCPGKFDQFHHATVEFFRQQGEGFTDKLSSIRCPVQLVYCGADVAYPKNHCEELLQALLDAGVDVDMEVVTDAPHFGTVTHAAEINLLLYHFLMKQAPATVPVPSITVVSPWAAIYAEAGWSSDLQSEDSSEEERENDLFAMAKP